MKYNFLGVVILFLFTNFLNAQSSNKNDFHSTEINKIVREFSDKLDLSTPLNSFVSFKYLQSKGKQSLYKSVNSFKIKGFYPKESSSDKKVTDTKRDALLNTKINEIIIYKDSVAGVITDFQPPMAIITYLTLENGKWLNAGEDLGNDINEARGKIKQNAQVHLDNIHQIEKLKNNYASISDLTTYLKNNGTKPEQYLLNAMAKHKIVIYGELHRRKKSWDLMKNIIKNPKFAKEVGAVFMELSSDKQYELDNFFQSKAINTTILLDIFREVQLNGWYDKGMYEFLIELWHLNKKLLANKQIQIIAVDEPRPFSTFKTSAELKKHFDQALERNDQMKQTILKSIKNNKDKRNNLFIVGLGHSYKTTLLDMAIGSQVGKMRPTVASQLKDALSDDEVFSIFQHIPIISNNGTVHGEVRNGFFDKAFNSFGNKSIAFDLKNSPFGKEPFDALYEISYNKKTGNYEDNYDGYLFLESLETETDEYLFNDIINTDYLNELRRRAEMLNTTIERWFEMDKVTIENLKEKLQYNPNKKRWTTL